MNNINTNYSFKTIDDAINYLIKYNHLTNYFINNKEDTFRALRNITMPYDLSYEYYELQDNLLQNQLSKKIITKQNNFPEGISLWLGDITTLEVDTIVNACNNQLLGCFTPLHNCIDNAIHSWAGLQVRRDLIKVMKEQNHLEETGQAKITKGYNLPSQYILHTVGPIVSNEVTKQNEKDLESCYLSCLNLCEKHQLTSIAFCSISTGIYGYPIEKASKVAIKAVKTYFILNPNSKIKKVIFNVFSKRDYDIYYNNLK